MTSPAARPRGLEGLAGGVVRVAALAFGCFGVVWGAIVLPQAWSAAPIEKIGAQIVDGAPYKAEWLKSVLPQLDAIERAQTSRPSSLHGAMMVRVRLLEQAIANGERREIDRLAGEARRSVGRVLESAPTNAFAWLILFWLENLTSGFTPDHLAYLRMSYLLGPHEGWIAVHRSRLTLGMFGALPPDLQRTAAAELVLLVDSGFYKDAAAILAGPAWNVRDALLPKLETVSLSNRQLLERQMNRLGAPVIIPGVERRNDRPWH